MDGLKVSIGIGNSYDSLSQIKKSYNEANLALKCAGFDSKENTIISYEEIGVYGLLFSIKDKSILEQYFETISIFEKYYEYEEIVGFERIKKEKISKEAFREALANAIVHRLWDINSNIKIK